MHWSYRLRSSYESAAPRPLVRLASARAALLASASAVSGHPLLRAAAVDAARMAKFSQTLLQGNPVKVSGVIVYNFVPPDDGTN